MAESALMGKVPFLWEGTDRKGNKIKGKSMAPDEAQVRTDLRRQGVVPSRIKKQGRGLKRGSAPTTADIAIFSRQLATMLAAGIPLVQAFEIVGHGHENPSMQKLILAVKADVEGGSALAEALSKHPLYFDDLFVNLVSAGEQAGALETLLDKIATYKEKTEAIKKKIKKAVTYPAAVLVVALVVTVILLIFVIPAFEDLFKGFGADLPAFTRMVIDLSVFVRTQGWILGILFGAAVSSFFYFKKRSRVMRHFLDRMALKMPIVMSERPYNLPEYEPLWSAIAANNIVLAIVGDFDSEQTLAQVRKAFGGLRTADEIPRVPFRKPVQRGPGAPGRGGGLGWKKVAGTRRWPPTAPRARPRRPSGGRRRRGVGGRCPPARRRSA